jgi:signal peptidase II
MLDGSDAMIPSFHPRSLAPRLALLLAVLVIALDQLSKWYFNHNYSYGEVRPVIPGYFNFTLLYNPGAAFSFLADAGGWQRHVFTVLAFLVSAWLGWGVFNRRFSAVMGVAAALIIGGALGNVIDRMMFGHVIDFIQVYYRNWYYPAFNIADSAICIGAVLMVLDSFRNGKEQS